MTVQKSSEYVNGEVDVFAIAGQSNGWGVGNGNTDYPDYDKCWCWDSNNKTWKHLTDENATVSVGSIILQWAIHYYNKTGRIPCFIQTSMCGSNLLNVGANSATGYNWSPNGDLRLQAASMICDALVGMANMGYQPNFKGIIWMQGEAEAPYMVSGEITEADYAIALIELSNFFKIYIPWDYGFLVVQTGTCVGSEDTGYAMVRNAQNNACIQDANIRMIYNITYLFPQLNWMNDDTIHYNQYGLDSIGYWGVEAYLNPACQ